MKEHKYEYTAEKKLISYYATVYDFSSGKTLFEKVVTGFVWGSTFFTLGALAIGFLWPFGG